MLKKHIDYYFRYLDHDAPAGVVVFLVALPLCLGIAIACGAPPFSGIIAGIVGGLVVSLASGSQVSVSGPAAGLTVIVASGSMSSASAACCSPLRLPGYSSSPWDFYAQVSSAHIFLPPS